MVTAVPGGTNLALNPEFVSGFTYWVAFGSTGLTYDVPNAWPGTASSGKLTGTATALSGVRTPINAESNKIVAAAGEAFSAAVRVKAGSGGHTGRIRIQFYNGSNVSQGSTDSSDIALSTTDFTTIRLESVVAPATTAYVVVHFLSNTNINGSIFYVSGFDIRKADTVDGFISGTQGSGYGWNGTAHQSTSYRNATYLSEVKGSGGSIIIEPRLFLADKNNNLGAEISEYILSGVIEMNSDRAIKTQFKGAFQYPNPIDPYVDYLAPFMVLVYPDGTVTSTQMGLFSIPPTGALFEQSYATGAFQGYDLTWNLDDDGFGADYTIAAGTVVTTAIKTILTGAGFTRYSIPNSAATLSVARTWASDKSKLTIINDLLNAIGYYTLFSDRYGILTSFPYNDLQTVQPATTLYSGEGSTVVGAIKKDVEFSGIFNKVRILKEGAATGSITWTQTNSNTASPVSTVNVGRTIYREFKYQDLDSLTVAKALAARKLQEAASLYSKYEIRTLPDPNRNVWEVYDTSIFMDNGYEVLSGRVRCIGWEIGFTPSSASMLHRVSRLEAY